MFVCSAWAKPRFSRNAKSSQNGKRDTFCTMRIWLHPKACFVHSSSFVMYVIILSFVSYTYFSLNTTRQARMLTCFFINTFSTPSEFCLCIQSTVNTVLLHHSYWVNYSPTDSLTKVLIIYQHLLVIALPIYYVYYVMDWHTICLVDTTLRFKCLMS